VFGAYARREAAINLMILAGTAEVQGREGLLPVLVAPTRWPAP
jgi:hypothetical protein